ncbi:hypothetical protein BDF19DRAFT_384802, partial [Syncephalis fuscata]
EKWYFPSHAVIEEDPIDTSHPHKSGRWSKHGARTAYIILARQNDVKEEFINFRLACLEYLRSHYPIIPKCAKSKLYVVAQRKMQFVQTANN